MATRHLASAGWIGLATLVVAALPATAAAAPGVFVSKSEGTVQIDNPTAVLLRDGQTTVLTVAQQYRGPVGNFAFVLPIPGTVDEEDVRTVESAPVDHLRRQTRPKLVEWRQRDPCEPATVVDALGEPKRQVERGATPAFQEGPYTVTVLDSDESNAADQWLRQRDYEVSETVADALKRPTGGDDDVSYVVAEADSQSLPYEAGRAKPPPLRVEYRSSRLGLPLPGTAQNGSGADDLLVFVLDRGSRFAVADATNVAVPTRIPVRASVQNNFTPFYETLVDRLADDGEITALTEYARDASKGGYFSVRDFATFGGEVAARTSAQPRTQGGQSGRPTGSPKSGSPSNRRIDRACLRKELRQMQSKLRKKLQKQLAAQMRGAGSSSAGLSGVNAGKLRSILSGAGLAKCIKRPKRPPPRKHGAGPSGQQNEGAEESVSSRALENGWTLSRLRVRLPAEPQSEALELTRAPALGDGRQPPAGRWGHPGDELDAHWERHAAPDANPSGTSVGLPNYRVRFRILRHWPGEVACDSPNWSRWRASELETDPTPATVGPRRRPTDSAADFLGDRIDWPGLAPNVRRDFSTLMPGVEPPDDLDPEHPSTATDDGKADEDP